MAEPCPLKRCDGHLEVWAGGFDTAGQQVQLSLCDVCGNVVEQRHEVDQDALPGMGG